MLVLSRKPGEQVVLGNGVTLTVVEVRGERVRLAFDAPAQGRLLPARLPPSKEGPAHAAGRAAPGQPPPGGGGSRAKESRPGQPGGRSPGPRQGGRAGYPDPAPPRHDP